MFIHEAASAALARGCRIKRSCGSIWSVMEIELGERNRPCRLFISAPKARVTSWNPSTEDLIADDWVLVP